MLGFTLFKMKGNGMSSKIPDDSYILASRWFLMFFLGEGKRVLIQHSTYGLIVKTVALVDHHGFIWLKADNNQHFSMEQIGPIDKAQVIGRVLNIFNRRD